jgi:hypothetical protein
MRFTAVIVAGAVLMLTSPAMTVLAKDNGAQKSEDKTSASSSCHAYEQAADGSWHQLPCEEVGPGGQTQHKGAARGREEDAR